MNSEVRISVTDAMLSARQLVAVDAASIDTFLRGDGLRLLFFAGPRSVRREAHDVAVAMRELLRSYGSAVGAALIDPEAEAQLQPRFRVSATPCLVFLSAGEVLEVLPRVRDWADYADAFQRYLGAVSPSPSTPGTTP